MNEENIKNCDSCGKELTPQSVGAKKEVNGEIIVLCEKCYEKGKKNYKEKTGYDGEITEWDEASVAIKLINEEVSPSLISDFLKKFNEEGFSLISLESQHAISYAGQFPGEDHFTDLPWRIVGNTAAGRNSELENFLQKLVDEYGFYDMTVTTKNFLIRQREEYSAVIFQPRLVGSKGTDSFLKRKKKEIFGALEEIQKGGPSNS